MDREKIYKIFQALRIVTHEHLDRLGLSDKGIVVRFGRGWATYFHPMLRKKGKSYPAISYGDKMIINAIKHPDWMNTQEMAENKLGWGNRFGYSPAVLMAAVVAHEIAHAYMRFFNMEPPKKVGKRRAHHGKDFYMVLEGKFVAHVEDMAIQIAEIVGDPALLDSTYSPPPPKPRKRRKKRKLPQPDTFDIGDIVKVWRKRENVFVIGKIVRWGGTRWTIVGKKYWCTGDYPNFPAYNGKEFKIYAPDYEVFKW